MKHYFTLIIGLCAWFSAAHLHADVCGKVDIGPAYIHLDVLESNHTIRKRELWGARGDACVIFDNGIVIKPTLLGASGDSDLWNGSLGVGLCAPFWNQLYITPLFGVSYTYFHSKYSLQLPHIPDMHVKVREKIRSIGPYLGLDICWSFADCYRFYASYQYTWSRVRTEIKPLFKGKNHTQGPSYAVSLERDLTDQWSINVGAAYNISLSKEKHGLRGYGVKIGTSYWF